MEHPDDSTVRTDPEVPVLVVGAGPVGLLVAAELARHGVQPRLVERGRRPPSRAGRSR